jgi:hypothetical protein
MRVDTWAHWLFRIHDNRPIGSGRPGQMLHAVSHCFKISYPICRSSSRVVA